MVIGGYKILRVLKDWEDSNYDIYPKEVYIPKSPHWRNRLILLHEMGHLMNNDDTMQLHYSTNKKDKLLLLQKEAAAWRWAVRRLNRPLTPNECGFILRAYGTYINAYDLVRNND